MMSSVVVGAYAPQRDRIHIGGRYRMRWYCEALAMGPSMGLGHQSRCGVTHKSKAASWKHCDALNRHMLNEIQPTREGG